MTSRTWGPDGGGIPINSANLNAMETDITSATNTANAAIPSSQKGAASGVASLDAGTKVPAAQLPDTTTTTKGAVQLAGDLAGTAAAPTVPALANKVQIGGDLGGTIAAPTVASLKGVALSATAPTAGQVLTASSGTAAAWAPPAGGVPAPAYPSGYWGVLQSGPDNTQAIDINQYFYPMWSNGGTITASGIWVDTAATAGVTLQLSAYSWNSAGTFTNLFNLGTFAMSATGFVQVTATNTLPSGFWFLGMKGSAASGAYHAVQADSLAPFPYTNSTNGPSTAGNSQGRYGGSSGSTTLTTTVGGTTTPSGTAYNNFGATIPPPKIWVQFQ